jgi:hypothetical protein
MTLPESPEAIVENLAQSHLYENRGSTPVQDRDRTEASRSLYSFDLKRIFSEY